MRKDHTEQVSPHVEETTRNQILAADPRISAWVSANAGSGKTRVLTNRVVRLLLAGVDPSRILCLTFTKAAAAEMANRLFRQLGEWATLSNEKLIAAVEELEGEVVSKERLIRARRLFARAIETPGGLKIQTIHAFAQAVLGRFPIESRVSPHFEVIEERTSSEILGEARWAVIERAEEGSDAALTRAVEDLTYRLDERGLDGLLSEVVSKESKVEQFLPAFEGDRKTLEALEETLGVAGETLEDVLSQSVEDILAQRQELLDVAACLDEGTKTDIEKAATLRTVLVGDAEGEDYETYVELLLTKEGTARARLVTKKISETYPHTEALLRLEQERIHAIEEKRKAFEIIEATTSLLEFSSHLLDEFNTRKRRRGVLDYADLISRTASLLEGPGNAWVHFKLDGGIDHILVDEAQDTSPQQWTIIEKLAGEFFAGKSAFDERDKELARSIFAVGDEKQSIYAFLGAEPKTFETKRLHFKSQVEAIGQTFSTLDLITSFRSTPQVLEAVDQNFSNPIIARDLTSTGTEIRHAPERENENGLVELWPTIKPSEEELAGPWDAPLDRKSPNSPRAELAGRIADTIERWIETKEPLLNGKHAIGPGDILILVQRRDAFVDEMIRALKKRGVPVAGKDRMVLTDQLAVMDLMALGEFALLPEDDLTLAVVLKSPFVGLSEEDLFDLAHGRVGILWQSLVEKKSERASFGKAHDFLLSVLARVETMAPFEFFFASLGKGEGFEATGRERLLTRLGPEAGDPIEEFLNLALSFERTEEPSLQAFLKWVKEDASEIKRDFDHDMDEVRVMTVHGSKGLEGNIVFLPDTCSVPSRQQDDEILFLGDPVSPDTLLWRQGTANTEAELVSEHRDALAQKRLEEHRRLFYVAMTRAKDRLYICGYETKQGRKEGCWYDIADRELREVSEELTDTSGATVLRLGKVPSERETEGQEYQEAAAIALPTWSERPLEIEHPKERFSPSHLPGSVAQEHPPLLSPLLGQEGDRFKRGLLIHTLLELAPELDLSLRERASRDYLARPAHGLSDKKQNEIWSEVSAILTDEFFADLFGPSSLAEVPLMGNLPGIEGSIRGQIDRLLVEPDRILIVDYKTNRPPPDREEDVAPVYQRQMAAYRALLQGLYPGRPVECALLWTDTPTLMRLSGARLDQIAAQISTADL